MFIYMDDTIMHISEKGTARIPCWIIAFPSTSMSFRTESMSISSVLRIIAAEEPVSDAAMAFAMHTHTAKCLVLTLSGTFMIACRCFTLLVVCALEARTRQAWKSLSVLNMVTRYFSVISQEIRHRLPPSWMFCAILIILSVSSIIVGETSLVMSHVY